jgi:hypothetical protein
MRPGRLLSEPENYPDPPFSCGENLSVSAQPSISVASTVKCSPDTSPAACALTWSKNFCAEHSLSRPDRRWFLFMLECEVGARPFPSRCSFVFKVDRRADLLPIE